MKKRLVILVIILLLILLILILVFRPKHIEKCELDTCFTEDDFYSRTYYAVCYGIVEEIPSGCENSINQKSINQKCHGFQTRWKGGFTFCV